MIAVCPNPFRDIDLKITKKAVKLLNDAGFETVICPAFMSDEENVIPPDVKITDISKLSDSCTLAIAIGGDGTILAVARRIFKQNIPVLGLNLGTKGFMAGIELDELDKIVDAARGNCQYTERMMLDVSLSREGSVICSGTVLNDVVIRGYSECVGFKVKCDSSLITAFSGDGIILSTPTGSTGYSMSAGGPIVEPSARNIIMSPICAHTMIARSFVLDPTRTVSVRTEKLHDRRAYLALDGKIVIDLANEDIITVNESGYGIKMVDFDPLGFFEIAYKKLI